MKQTGSEEDLVDSNQELKAAGGDVCSIDCANVPLEVQAGLSVETDGIHR